VPRSPELRRVLEGTVLDVAPLLLGATLRHEEVACRITEVEAYDGSGDPGSHAFRGPTARNAVMFGPAGHLYVYFTYGMHWCANVVCSPEGGASAVLFRAGEIIDGLETARARRVSSRNDRDLARGPARLCQALGIAREQNGHDLSAPPLTLELGAPPGEVLSGPRVGLRQAAERPWRFWLPGEPTVSPYRPAAPRKPKS
jgi:DNA-3-methyladenine glycosylase